MGFFPTNAIDGDEIGPNTNGSYFKYVAVDDKWIIINNLTISDLIYNASNWDTNLDGASKNAIRDKIESLPKKYTLSGDSTTIYWNVDGAANTNYQNIDLDNYYTVPSGATAAHIRLEMKDDVISYLYYGATEQNGQNLMGWISVVNRSVSQNVRCPLASGNIIKMKCSVTPGSFNRLYINLIGWFYD